MLSTLDLIKVIKPYFSKYKHILVYDLIFALLTTLAGFILPLVLRQLTNYGASGSLTGSIIASLSLIFIVLKVVEVIARYYMTNVGHRMGALIETDMRRDLFDHLMALDNDYYNENRVGELMSKVTNDLFDITEFSHHAPEEYLIFAVQTVVSFIILGIINLPLTLVIFIMLPLMFVVSRKFRQKMGHEQMNQRRQIGKLNSGIEDSLSGINVVKSFANEDQEINKFKTGNEDFYYIKKKYYISMAGFMTVTSAFEGVMYIIVLVMGGVLILNGSMLASDMIVFIMYINMLITSLKRIIQFTENFQKGLTGIQRFHEVMTAKPRVIDSSHPIELEDVAGRIEARHLVFDYHNGERVLDDINFTIEPGQQVAFVGPSGAGKSTLINLIPRFYDLTSGEILVDGHNIQDISLFSLRDHIGIVQQDVYLFAGTIADNIRYGKLDASDAEIRQAADLAGATGFIRELPEGFNTNIGERGARLSGGQKQRISIARVFLKNPPILILDEATSALDNQSELVVQESLDKLAQGRTTITIAHRLTTVEDSDLIYVLTDDGIIEQGSHQDLMDQKGYYYRLYSRSLD
ncbi:Putative multidrug export ATP-binding/permease protein SAV1866 [Alloiococcus otitis]|uniref:Multidrug resistance ABC transporter ATP-binding and permease protein n=1 Tax=Alloiococcus otitis ATCC 51267 TaxID=883081 RepID=K9ESZ1_9LACT|nr:ABC transporter ATP-binding protein [Alloiococcus otitis]EKU94087.1 hypothetical protein HMPREF9698_00399 [Alloiococcus otitis ATCC 51267]SUU80999.1 Putative multidrug export ATP-binding/permease protein SAV1866 [Alloiococcus otitis]